MYFIQLVFMINYRRVKNISVLEYHAIKGIEVDF